MVGQLGQGMVGQVELEAVGKPVGLMLGRRQAAAAVKTVEAFQFGRATVEKQLPGLGIVVEPGWGTVVVLGLGTVVVVQLPAFVVCQV